MIKRLVKIDTGMEDGARYPIFVDESGQLVTWDPDGVGDLCSCFPWTLSRWLAIERGEERLGVFPGFPKRI